MRIAINGLGRIGRLLCKTLISAGYDVAAVNDPMSLENATYLLKYDSVYGSGYAMKNNITAKEGAIEINRKIIRMFHETEPGKLPWAKESIDIVVECSGKFISRRALTPHLDGGAKRVLLSTTGETDIPVVIRGFNDSSIPADKIIASGGCMTNCTVPVLHILDSHYGVESVHINVTHAYTSRQLLTDGPAKDLRRGRAAASSIIPVDIDLFETLELFFPALKGNVTTSSTRIPVDCGALVDFYVMVKHAADVDSIVDTFQKHSDSDMKGIVGVTHDPIVSNDILANPHSALIDATLTKISSRHLKISAWFDDQFAFTQRMVEILNRIAGMQSDSGRSKY